MRVFVLSGLRSRLLVNMSRLVICWPLPVCLFPGIQGARVLRRERFPSLHAGRTILRLVHGMLPSRITP